MAAKCKFCSNLIEGDDEGKCLDCHMKKNQEFSIREPYRKKAEKSNPTFDQLSDDGKIHLEYIQSEKFAVLEFEVKDTGKKKPKKTFSFNKYHRYQDDNFFGDRPGIYVFQTTSEDGVKGKVGESRNLSQRLRTHKSEMMEIGTKGFIVFCCTKGENWPDDPLNYDVLRLTIERILQANIVVESNRTEKWVTPTPDHLKLAINICSEIFKKRKSWSWLKMKEAEFVLPRIELGEHE